MKETLFNMGNTEYNAKDFVVHEGLSHVRVRPDMYIGSTEETGLHHLVWEILDNSIDEVMNGFGNRIEVILHGDNSVTVSDNGRGIPVDIHPGKQIPAVRLTFEVLGAGGKFSNDAYKKSGGLHGVGASVVNALSTKVEIDIAKDGYRYSLAYKNQQLKQDLRRGRKTKEHGTSIRFWPDESIFPSIELSPMTIKNRLRQLAYLNKGLTIVFRNENTVTPTEDIFFFKGGLADFLDYICEGKTTIGKKLSFETSIEDVDVSVAFQYTDDYNQDIISFVNNIPTIEGGKHEEGFKAALTRAINENLKNINQERKRGKKEYQLQGSDVSEGLTAILSVQLKEPKFGGQTKTKLSNPEVRGQVMSATYDAVMKIFSENEKLIKDIITKVSQNYESRERIKAIKDVAKKTKTIGLDNFLSSGKFADCTTKDPDRKEIFLVEGDSAGGSAKQGRNKTFQAILALKGKPLNVEKKSLKDVVENEELRSLISEIGAGFGKDDFNIEKVKSKKIIIMTDADVDGAHIQIILITFFYRYMRPLIEAGYLYVALPPLYKVYNKEKELYAYSEKDLSAAIKKVGRGYEIQRYKGLGEMDSSQLWETTMNPENRTLYQITVGDAAMLDREITVFMGSKVEPRKNYIMENM